MQKVFYLFLSILFYSFAILVIGLTPLCVLYNCILLFGDPIYNYCFSIVLSIISFFFLMKVFTLKHQFVKYLILFIMIYIALIVGSNQIHDYVLKKLFLMFEKNGMTNSEQYENLWSMWSNDLSRNLMYFFGLFYSLFSTSLTFLFMYIINKIKQKKINS